MENLKESLQQLLKGEKIKLYMLITKIAISFLFFIGLYFRFIVETSIIGGAVSLSDLPGSFIFEFAIFVSILLYFYSILIDNTNISKKILLVQLIAASLIYVYGVLVYRIGFPNTARAGFGKHFEFVFLVLLWVSFFKDSLFKTLFLKYLLKEDVEEGKDISSDEDYSV